VTTPPTETLPGSQISAAPEMTAAAALNDYAERIPRSRIILSSMIGTTIEFYDFYVYATAAVAVFPALFFPKADATAALLSSFATFGLAFIARPLGSLIFGHFGDRVGRKATLVASLLTMGIATFLIGLLPTYVQAGVWAPAMLSILRFCQGLGLGGEWSGAVLLATETAPKGKRGWAGMWPQLGAPLGFLLANGLFLILVHALNHTEGALDGDFMVWGWRIPFLLSIVMVILGLYVRMKLEETPVFQHAVTHGKRVASPIKETFRTAWRPLILSTFIMVGTYAIFYITTTWILSYGIAKPDNGGLGIPYGEFLPLQLIGILFFIAGVPLSNWLSDKYGRRKPLLIITTIIVLYGFTFGAWIPATATKGDVLSWLIVGMFLMGLSFGPMSALLPELFPTNVRYTGSGIAYNVASILGAALTPFVATWLVSTHGVFWVGIYMGCLAVLTIIALLLSQETSDVDLAAV